MGDVNWNQYEIPLVPQPPRELRAPPAPLAPIVSRDPPDPRPLAGRGERLAAALLDGVVCLIALSASLLIATALGQHVQATSVRLGAVAGVLAVEVVQIILLSLRGQTLGKALMGLRIVAHSDGSNPGFLRAVVLRRVLPGFLAAVPCLGKLFFLIDCLSIFGDTRRCYHDLFAGTKVVRTE
ncbi:MAG TPA: RDD family protein [Gemmataceae bacterium]|nr:RDD family protein [Gemmataceae bacterium]